jgi:dTMP kinase
MYIIFEGIDTTGKSTQVELFKKRHKNIITTKEPGGTELGLKLREILLNSDKKISFNAEMLLFLADRAEHYDKVVKMANSDVISDRGFISGISYALTNHKELDMNFLIKLNKFALSENLPDKIILFITNKELINSRLKSKQKDTIEQRGIDYLIDVQELMRKVLKALHVEFLEIDSSNTIEQIYKQIEDFIYG